MTGVLTCALPISIDDWEVEAEKHAKTLKSEISGLYTSKVA